MSPQPLEFSIPVCGIPTRVWNYGSKEGPPLILVHGFRGDHHGLEGLARALSKRLPNLQIVVPDLPGFGDSSAAQGRAHDMNFFGSWLREFTSALDFEGSGYGILGHSFGSLVVANAVSQGLQPTATILINPISAPALAGPQRILTQLAIAYYAAADRLPERPARQLLGNPVIVRAMSEVMAKTGDRELRSWIHDQHHRYFSRFASTTSLLEAFRASVSHTVLEYAESLPGPTLVIVGDRDDITPMPAQLTLAHKLRDSTLRVIPGVGHLIHYEAVEEASDEISAFLTQRFAA